MKKISKRHVSREAVLEMRDMLEKIAVVLCKKSVEEFEQQNENRHRLGLPPHKRLTGYAVRSATKNVLKSIRDKDTGYHLPTNESLGDTNMRKRKRVTKSAKKQDTTMHEGYL